MIKEGLLKAMLLFLSEKAKALPALLTAGKPAGRFVIVDGALGSFGKNLVFIPLRILRRG